MADETCAMKGCNCPVAEGEQYCSDYCKEHEAGTGPGDGEGCGCGHPGCH